MTASSLQHKFIAIDEGHATLLHINERDQSKNWIVPIGHIVLANWQGHGPGFGQSGIQLLEFNTEGGIVWHRSKADLDFVAARRARAGRIGHDEIAR